MKHRLPAFGISRELPATGGLMGYFANFAELYRETAVYIDKCQGREAEIVLGDM